MSLLLLSSFPSPPSLSPSLLRIVPPPPFFLFETMTMATTRKITMNWPSTTTNADGGIHHNHIAWNMSIVQHLHHTSNYSTNNTGRERPYRDRHIHNCRRGSVHCWGCRKNGPLDFHLNLTSRTLLV